MMRYTELCGDLVRLRALEPEDLNTLYDVENDPQLWCVGENCTPYSRHVLQNYIKQTANNVFVDGQLRLMIETCTKNRNTVGIIDLMQFNPRFRRAEVGIVIFPPFRHLGYAKDALSILCDYALCYLHIHQLYAYISVRNTASQKLFQNMGFQRTAVLSDWLFINGAYEDVALFQKIW